MRISGGRRRRAAGKIREENYDGYFGEVLVKELRERTGCGMMDCKKVLVETDGDIEKAVELLREKGLAKAVKKSGRIAAEGIVDSYIHLGGRIGVLVEVNCETDFVAKTDEFKALVRDIAMQIAAANPKYVREEEVDPEEIAKEREIMRVKAINDGKPEKIVDKIVDGQHPEIPEGNLPDGSALCQGYG